MLDSFKDSDYVNEPQKPITANDRTGSMPAGHLGAKNNQAHDLKSVSSYSAMLHPNEDPSEVSHPIQHTDGAAND